MEMILDFTDEKNRCKTDADELMISVFTPGVGDVQQPGGGDVQAVTGQYRKEEEEEEEEEVPPNLSLSNDSQSQDTLQSPSGTTCPNAACTPPHTLIFIIFLFIMKSGAGLVSQTTSPPLSQTNTTSS
ncbi:unnamed protein product [Pleuronectes platessa]|uniref:Uncharacterized protein n=1 Tax=Pleuronectes platessa TaxID=8262 RepID=A0A9N7Z0R8_PLEPL|nr:unnamed protein product [Pleuronectes platessa]